MTANSISYHLTAQRVQRIAGVPNNAWTPGCNGGGERDYLRRGFNCHGWRRLASTQVVQEPGHVAIARAFHGFIEDLSRLYVIHPSLCEDFSA